MTTADIDSELREMNPSCHQETENWFILMTVSTHPAGVNPSFPAQVGHSNPLKYFPGFLK